MKRLIERIFAIQFAATLIILCSLATVVQAQSGGQSIPDRGFHPSASYSLSNIETINTTNGNVMLNIPLAALPAGRGGHPGFQLALRYNSKIWDGQPDRVENPFHQGQMMDVVFLTKSDQGGWNYNLSFYHWSLYNRNSDGVTFPSPDCRHFNIWKMKVTFPDGSMREFRPYGFDDQCDDNYFTVQPAAGMSYFSTDGSYTRLDFGSSTSDWTLYFADGSKVTNQSGVQRTYDRNGNYTQMQNVPNYNNTGHLATVVQDQLGRTIAVEYATGEDYVHSTGVNGEAITTTVKWGPTYVKKMYRAGNHFQYDVNLNNVGINSVKEIILPSQLGANIKFLFGYNGWPTPGNTTPSVGWGELNSVTLPSGAVSTYQYDMDNESGSGIQANWVLKNTPTRKDLNYNLEYDQSTTAAPTDTWFYFISDSFAQITGPDGGITKEWFGDVDGNIWNSGLVHKTELPDGTVIDRVWNQNRPNNPPGVTISSTLGVNPFIEKESVSIPDSVGTLVKTAVKEYRRDKNGNVTQIKEYDWVPFGTTPNSTHLRRVTNRAYHVVTPDALDSTTSDPDSYEKNTAPKLLTALASTEVGNGTQTLSRSEFFYDNALTTGNLTLNKSWDSTKAGYSNPLTSGNSISYSKQYDSFGNETHITDPRGLVTKSFYGTIGSVADLYPTEITRAFGTTKQRQENIQYDFNTGLVTRTTDVENNVVKETDYDDLGRVIEVRQANNVTNVKTVTQTEYSAINRRVITRSDLNVANDGKRVSIQHFDQLGRIRLSRSLEDSTTEDPTDETDGIKVQTRYAVSSAGHTFELTSNPYRAATSSAASSESTMGWTREKNDRGGRAIEEQTFGGAALPAPWGTNSTSTGQSVMAHDANFMTLTEQSGTQVLRIVRSATDSLGRLVRFDEPDDNHNLGSIDQPFQSTTYSYDAENNLVGVSQGSQTRTFNYSSLSRLTSAFNPESGTTNYQYDNNGNLKLETDARNITKTFGDYDSLNRPTTITYSDGTPTVTYGYDAASVPFSKGRLTSISSSVSTMNITEYDALGRVKAGNLILGSQTYPMSYTYDLVGHLKLASYPSGRTVLQSYDNAGRVTSVAGNLGDNVQRDYSTGLTYSAMGQLTQEQLGTNTPVYNKRFYNSRGQLAEIRSSTTANDNSWNRGAIINHYSATCGGVCLGTAMPDNNGSLRKQEIKVPNDEQVSTSDTYLQNYEYDSLNRLLSVRENKNGGSTQWQQSYTYDRYGNRSIDSSGTFGANINNMQAKVVANTTTNRMYAPGETEQNHPLYNYDAAGNQTKDHYSVAGTNYDRTFDAENRTLTSVASGSFGSQTSTYSYDADGKRVRRTINGVETWQVYGLNGELMAEYAANAPANSPQKEYGYRNGQLLIVATSGTASGNPPTSLSAAPVNGGAQVSLNWTAASGAVNYRIERKAAGQSFVLATTSTTNSAIDSGVNSGNAYLYRVCSANPSGICTSAFSNIALGAAVGFPTNPTIVSIVDDPSGASVTTVKAAHINELRTAVNAVRTLAAMLPGSWTNQTIAPGVQVKKEDITDLRDELGEALEALGISTSPYADPVLASGANGTLIKKIHITQLRERSTSGIGGAGGAGVSSDLRWLVTDHLGSPRLVLTQSGAFNDVSRHDYLPFGEEIKPPTGGRTTQQGYDALDNVRQKFTAKERDTESNLDYFIARYYSSLQGRFVSADEPFADQQEEDPQSWNLYTYVGNQPTIHTDPFGLWKQVDCENAKGMQCWQSDREDDTIYSLAQILGVNYLKLDAFLQHPTVRLGRVFDVSGFWEWAGIERPKEAVLVDLVDPSEIPPDRYRVEIEVNIPVPGPIRKLGKRPPGFADKLRKLMPKFPDYPGWSTRRWGNVMKWGSKDQAARDRIKTLTKEELQREGVTKEMAEGVRDFYKKLHEVDPWNESAAGRADLMQKAVDLLK